MSARVDTAGRAGPPRQPYNHPAHTPPFSPPAVHPGRGSLIVFPSIPSAIVSASSSASAPTALNTDPRLAVYDMMLYIRVHFTPIPANVKSMYSTSPQRSQSGSSCIFTARSPPVPARTVAQICTRYIMSIILHILTLDLLCLLNLSFSFFPFFLLSFWCGSPAMREAQVFRR